MAVPVNRELVQAMIDEGYGSVDGLVAEWEVKYQNDPDNIARPRDRSTIYKWLDNGLPAKKDILFGFSALLDVDPISIVRTDKEFIVKNFAKERKAFQISVKNDTILAPFRIIYLPWWQWPNQKVSQAHFGRDWFVANHLYEPGEVANVYAAFLLSTRPDISATRPHVYHIAYQQKHAIDRLWRPYGVIIANGKSVRSISESGDWQEISDETGFNNTPVETFFGPRATRFKLASFHQFKLQVEAPSTRRSAVRFH